MMKIKAIITFLSLTMSILTAVANVKIHGKIIDEDNKPLEFVTIRIAGTAIGAQSNLDGDLKKGDKVRVTGGVFSGAEGYFVRIKGDRRLVVTIKGIAAVATAFISPTLIEKIDG